MLGTLHVIGSAERYLERNLRERSGFVGTPVQMKFRKK